MVQRTTVDRLAQALSWWEQTRYIIDNLAESARPRGEDPALYSRHEKATSTFLAGHLLRARSETYKDALFAHSGTRFEAVAFGLANRLPAYMHAWSAASRRVFHVPADLQNFLADSAMQGIRASDIVWPFESFGIQLESPLRANNQDYDFILYARIVRSRKYSERAGHCLFLIPKAIEKTPWLSARSKALIVRWKKEGQWGLVHAFLVRHLRRKVFRQYEMTHMRLQWLREYRQDAERKVKLSSPRHPDQIGNQAIRILVGLCLYLQHIPSRVSAPSNWTPAQKTLGLPDPTLITNRTQICTVSTRHLLPREEGVVGQWVRGRTGVELRYHDRREHRRRPPRTELTHPKTVRVRQTEVRKDRKHEVSLPSGAVSVLV